MCSAGGPLGLKTPGLTHTHIMRGIQMWPLRMHPKVKGILPKHAVARRNTGDALAQQRQDH